MIMEELVGGGGALSVIGLNKNDERVRIFQTPEKIDAILILERATNNSN